MRSIKEGIEKSHRPDTIVSREISCVGIAVSPSGREYSRKTQRFT